MKLFRFILIVLITFCVHNYAKCQIITTVAGGAIGHGGYWGEGGAATAAQLDLFEGLLVDNNGNIFITDAGASVMSI